MGHYRYLLGQPWRVHFRQQPRNFVHRHTFYEPCVVVSGHGRFWLGDQVYDLNPGDLFMPDPNADHEITSLETRDLELLFTAFVVTEVADGATTTAEDQLVRRFLRQHAPWCAGQSHLAAYLVWVEGLTREASLRSRGFLIEEAMRLLVLQVMSALAGDRPADEPGEPADELILRRVRRAIDAHLHEPVYTSTIARASGMSERSLRRLLRQQLQCTVIAEIHERKMQRAAALLALPEFTVAEAARQVGIDDQAQFSRLFKRVMGVTPRDFRRSKIPRASGRTIFSRIGGVALRTEFRDAEAAVARITGRSGRSRAKVPAVTNS